MKSRGFGFESSVNTTIQNKIQYLSFPYDIKIKGIQMSVAYCTLGTSQFIENTHMEVLAIARVPQPPSNGQTWTSDNPTPLPADDGLLAAMIIKSWLTTPTQTGQGNETVTNMNLDIELKANDPITILLSHDGEKGDMEVQGVIFYE